MVSSLLCVGTELLHEWQISLPDLLPPGQTIRMRCTPVITRDTIKVIFKDASVVEHALMVHLLGAEAPVVNLLTILLALLTLVI